ncbi:Tetratricopeptide repeat-containing protein [Selenomonas sp. WCT3]|uniref:O-linked N-acetylglucosamine transferase, SPINDLY family protein n=1 Tax=Selenomonas sp. WCT3 TaxID=3158785 RepID=UPI00088EAFD6|nr:Tetratricopeptide repeat-containing protein [Selenomonas ruminantium]
MTNTQEILVVYQQALTCWKQGKLEQAEKILQDFWRETGNRSLRGMLLLAYILRDKKEYVSEVKVLEELLQQFPETPERDLLADAWSVLGAALRMLGESELSVAAFRKSIELEPNSVQKVIEGSNAIFSANAIADVSPAYMQELYALYRNLLAELNIEPYSWCSWKHSRIRVGYLSADFRNHAVGQFIRSLFCQYDRTRFAIYAYSLHAVEDEVTQVLKNGATTWRTMEGASWSEIAAQVRQDEIDILVDLAGHTARNALPVFAFHAATVQLSGIGYFNSTGIYDTTGFLSDVYCASEMHSPYFTEPLLRLPHSHFCYQPFAEFPEVGKPAFVRNGYITFGCFNNFAKVTDAMLLIWKQILEAVPTARLLLKHMLLGEPEGREYTLNRLRALGMPLSRIELRGFSKEYLEQYRDMDIALDTSPYPGGLTTCEALYMGVPVVSLVGNRHGARFGYSFLANIGLSELAAKTERAYCDIAVQLANDTELLGLLHRNLRGMMEKSPLMDVGTYMKDLEDLYEKVIDFSGSLHACEGR